MIATNQQIVDTLKFFVKMNFDRSLKVDGTLPSKDYMNELRTYAKKIQLYNSLINKYNA
jgi:hypothetical protein